MHTPPLLIHRAIADPPALSLTLTLITLLLASPSALSNPLPCLMRTPVPPIVPGATDTFEDVTSMAGIDFMHQFCHDRIANILLSNGAGAAAFDYDNDGLIDLYFLNWGPLEGVTKCPPSSPRQPNRLYRNRGNGTFEDVTTKAALAGSGFASAITAGDFDNDGHTDLYVVRAGPNQLFRNRGDGTFENVTSHARVADPGTGISATFLDYDNDGLLDLFVVNYLTFDPSTISDQNPGAYPGPLAYPGEPNTLYRNRGNGTFDDVSVNTGIWLQGHRGMSVSAFDADRNGHVDLYVSNDDTPNALWLNNGHGQFQDVARQCWAAFNSIGEAAGSMNATIADIDANGWPDIYVTRFGYGSLYLRQNNGLYFDEMRPSGLGQLTQNYVGWGGSFVDFDNDGDPDLFIVNGSAFHLNGSLPLLLENLGNVTFINAANGGSFFQTPIDGRGTAILDFDNDGRLDLLVTTLGNRPFLLRNRSTNSNHWLKLQLQGSRSNRNGYGALISLTANNRTWHSEATCPTGFLSQGDPRVHFGLGTAPLVDLLEIRWPSGTLQRLCNIPVNQTLKLREPSPESHPSPLP